MFAKCAKLTELDLSGFSTAKATDMSYMFSGCTALETIYASDAFVTDKVTRGSAMFSKCDSLTGGRGTMKESGGGLNHTYARIDEGEDAPGYFTAILEWIYEICDGQAILEGFSGKLPAELEIPSMLGGCTVTELLTSLFSEQQMLESVTIPAGVTRIGPVCFENCTGLRHVNLPDGVTEIGSSAFSGCSSPESALTIPASVTTIGGGAFSGCSALASLSVAKGNTSYAVTDEMLLTTDGKTLVSSFGSRSSVTVPAAATTISNNAFYGCTALESVMLPPGLTTIGDFAFSNCTALRTLMLPAGLSDFRVLAYTAEDLLEMSVVFTGVPAANSDWKMVSLSIRRICYTADNAEAWKWIVLGNKLKNIVLYDENAYYISFGIDNRFHPDMTCEQNRVYRLPDIKTSDYEITRWVDAKSKKLYDSRSLVFNLAGPGETVVLEPVFSE